MRHEPLGHQKSLVIFVSGAPVEIDRGIVSVVDLEMNGAHAHFPSHFLGKSHGLIPKTTVTEGRVDVQLVDEGIVAMKLKAEAEGENYIANGPLTL